MSDFAFSTRGFTRHVTQVNGIDCVWYEIGDGDPIVYFHGGGTYHGFEWARDWAGEARVILPYHPNFGESGDADFTSLGAYVWHYRAFFAAIDLEEFALVGASAGGHIAVRYALAESRQVRKLVLAAPAGLQSPRAPMPNFAEIPHVEQAAYLASNRDFLAPFWPPEPSEAWKALRAREVGAVIKARQGEEAGDHFLRTHLADLSMPVLLLWGEEDRFLPLPLLDEWRASLPAASHLTIAQGGHLLLDECIEARDRALDFLLA